MMLGRARRAADTPGPAPDQGSTDRGAAPIELPPPGSDSAAGRRAERAEWLRRRRLERQLHDGAALRISALSLQIGLFRHRVPAAAGLDTAVDALQDELSAALQELRDVSSQIYPPLLDQAGLGPALREAADRICVPARIRSGPQRYGPAAEGAAYYAVAECLEALDVDAPPVEVVLRRDRDGQRLPLLVVEVVGADVRHAEAMLEQVWQLGGTIEITRESGAGTITARIPCE